MDDAGGEAKALRRALDQCRETLQDVKAENEELRRSAESFGNLAERLNDELRAERREGQDRRRVRRGGPDRRASGSPVAALDRDKQGF